MDGIVLFAIIVGLLLVLGAAAAAFGVDSRPGFDSSFTRVA